MNRGWLLKITLLAVALVLVAVACAQEATPAPAPGAPTPEVAKKPVRIYHIPDITGPVSIVTVPLNAGMQDYVRWQNEQGGINGHRIELVFEDSGYEVPRILAIYSKFKAQGAAITVQYSSGGGEATKPLAERDRTFVFNFGQSDPQYYPPAYNFTWGVAYGDGMGAFLDWVKANWKESRPPKIGIFTYDNAFGRAPMEPGERYARYLGFDWYGTEFAGWVPADTTPQLLKFRDAGVDFFYSQFLAQTATVAVRDWARLGLQGQLTPVFFWWGPLDQIIEAAGADAEGVMGTNLNAIPEDTVYPKVETLRAVAAKSGKKFNDPYIRGWRGGEFISEIVRRGLEQVGDDPDKLTGDILREAALSIGYEQFDSGLGPKEGIKTPNYRVFQDTVRITRVQGGKVTTLTDFVEAPHLFPTEFANLFPGEPTYE